MSALSKKFGYFVWPMTRSVDNLIDSPTAGSFGFSAQTGSGVVRGGPEVRFHGGSTRLALRQRRAP